MGFFNFFKRDISEEEFQEQQKVKRGLEKTRTGFFQRIVNTLTNAPVSYTHLTLPTILLV